MCELSAKLNEISIRKNIPLTGTLELTYRCPLKCRHCYLPQTQGKAAVYPKKELKTKDWKRVLREIKKAGCLYLVFTGGEPFLREDLGELCVYAAKLNFSIKVFTSGFNLKGKFLKQIKNLPISFELSVYGKMRTHDKITQKRNSFKTSLLAAERLKKGGFGVKLKMPLMRANFNQAEYVFDLARKKGFGVSFDPVITSAIDGNKETLKYRLTEKQLGTILKNDKLKLLSEIKEDSKKGPDFICGAGRNSFAVNPYGDISPCLELPIVLGNLKKQKFNDIWKKNKWLLWWRGLKMSDVKVCRDCRHKNFCSRCPGMAMAEDGDLMGPSSFACELTKVTKKALDNQYKYGILWL